MEGPGSRAGGLAHGSYNFVRVQGALPRERPVMVSAALPHTRLADGRPVLYAGTASFAGGQIEWWSNWSGTYQPHAAFRDRAELPAEKFVPWQELQRAGLFQQRGMLRDRRSGAAIEASTPASAPGRSIPGGAARPRATAPPARAPGQRHGEVGSTARAVGAESAVAGSPHRATPVEASPPSGGRRP